MKLEVKANSIIDTLIPEIEEVEHVYKAVPRGTYINGSKYEVDYRRGEQANRKLQLAIDMLGFDVVGIIRAARRWYINCGWQYCLSEDVAARLIAFYAVARKDELADKRPGTIAEWNERSRRWRNAG